MEEKIPLVEKEVESFNVHMKNLDAVFKSYMSKNMTFSYPSRIAQAFDTLYSLKSDLENLTIEKPKRIQYRLVSQDSFNQEGIPAMSKTLEINNLDALIKEYGQSLVLHSSALYVEQLNYNYAVQKNLATKRPQVYFMGRKIKLDCFDEEKGEHPEYAKLPGEFYSLNAFFDYVCVEKNKSFEEVFYFNKLREAVKDILERRLEEKNISSNDKEVKDEKKNKVRPY